MVGTNPQPLVLRIAKVVAPAFALVGIAVVARLIQDATSHSLSVVAVVPLAVFIVMAAVAAALAVGLWTERHWSRPLPVVFWLLWAVYVSTAEAVIGNIAPSAAFVTQLPFAAVSW